MSTKTLKKKNEKTAQKAPKKPIPEPGPPAIWEYTDTISAKKNREAKAVFHKNEPRAVVEKVLRRVAGPGKYYKYVYDAQGRQIGGATPFAVAPDEMDPITPEVMNNGQVSQSQSQPELTLDGILALLEKTSVLSGKANQPAPTVSDFNQINAFFDIKTLISEVKKDVLEVAKDVVDTLIPYIETLRDEVSHNHQIVIELIERGKEDESVLDLSGAGKILERFMPGMGDGSFYEKEQDTQESDFEVDEENKETETETVSQRLERIRRG